MTIVMNNCTAFSDCGEGPVVSRGRSIGAVFAAALLILAALCSRALGADFQVQPTRLYLSGGEKSGAFTVINNGNEKIDFQISVKEWAQDAEGKDVYADAADIVFFPKIMTVEPNGQRAIRVGIKGPLSLTEKTYRLFVEEIPTPKKDREQKTTGKIRAGLTIAFRFATPIFVKPLKPQESAVVEKLEMRNGAIRAIVRNTGNIHVKLLGIVISGKAADGGEVFAKEFAGWYLLHGHAQTYEAVVPKEQCGALKTIDVKAQAENLTITGTLNVQKQMCAQ